MAKQTKEPAKKPAAPKTFKPSKEETEAAAARLVKESITKKINGKEYTKLNFDTINDVAKAEYIAFKPTETGMSIWRDKKESVKPVQQRDSLEAYAKAIATNDGYIIATPAEFIDTIIKRDWINESGNYTLFIKSETYYI